MARIGRKVLVAAVSLAAAGMPTLLLFAIFDLAWFQPRIAQLRALQARAHPDEREPPTIVRELVLTEQPHGLRGQIVQLILSRRVSFEQHISQRDYTILGALALPLVAIHVSETSGSPCSAARRGRAMGSTA